MNKDWIRTNSKQIEEWIKSYYEHSKELAINLDDQDVAGRTQAIIEARAYKKLLVDVQNTCEGKKQESLDNV